MSDSDSDVPVKRRSAPKKPVHKHKKAKKTQKVEKKATKRKVISIERSDSESEEEEVRHVKLGKGRKKRVETSDDDSDQEPEEAEDQGSDNNNTDEEEEQKNEGSDTPLIPSGEFSLPTAKEQPKVWVLVGSCASGKTYMLKYIQYLYGTQKHFKFGITFTATGFTGDYKWAPDRSVMKYDEAYFEKYIDNLKRKVEEGVAQNGEGWKLPHNYVVFDDNNGLLASSPFMINFISTHRHTSTSIFILSQLLTAKGSVNTTMRNNTSFALMWPSNNLKAVKGLHENYGGMMTHKEFKAALDTCRDRKYSCLVLKNAADHRTISEQFTTIKAGKYPENFSLKF
jgi:hypothetical protein